MSQTTREAKRAISAMLKWPFSDRLFYGVIRGTLEQMLKTLKAPKLPNPALLPISIAEFLDFYNKNLPSDFPRATTPLLKKFQETHTQLFKNGDRWSLDLHRKKVIEWLPRNSKLS